MSRKMFQKQLAENFAKRVKELRLRAKLSQEKVAEAMGSYQADVCRSERGLMVPSMIKVAMYAKFFGVSTDYMLGLSSVER